LWLRLWLRPGLRLSAVSVTMADWQSEVEDGGQPACLDGADCTAAIFGGDSGEGGSRQWEQTKRAKKRTKKRTKKKTESAEDENEDDDENEKDADETAENKDDETEPDRSSTTAECFGRQWLQKKKRQTDERERERARDNKRRRSQTRPTTNGGARDRHTTSGRVTSDEGWSMVDGRGMGGWKRNGHVM